MRIRKSSRLTFRLTPDENSRYRLLIRKMPGVWTWTDLIRVALERIWSDNGKPCPTDASVGMGLFAAIPPKKKQTTPPAIFDDGDLPADYVAWRKEGDARLGNRPSSKRTSTKPAKPTRSSTRPAKPTISKRISK